MMEELNVGDTIICARTYLSMDGQVKFIKNKKYKIVYKSCMKYSDGKNRSEYTIIDEKDCIFSVPNFFFDDNIGDATFLTPNLLRIRKIKSLGL